MKNDIDVYFVNLPEKDPSDLGFENDYSTIKRDRENEIFRLNEI